MFLTCNELYTRKLSKNYNITQTIVDIGLLEQAGLGIYSLEPWFLQFRKARWCLQDLSTASRSWKPPHSHKKIWSHIWDLSKVLHEDHHFEFPLQFNVTNPEPTGNEYAIPDQVANHLAKDWLMHLQFRTHRQRRKLTKAKWMFVAQRNICQQGEFRHANGT